MADGIGGYAGGELASSLAITHVRDFIEAQHRDPEGTWPGKADRSRSIIENVALQAAKVAHLNIAKRRVGVHAQMGSTLVLMYAVGTQAVVAHVGDSRIYRLRGDELTALTRDHSLWAELQASGSPIARESFGYKNIITRALGIPDAHAAEAKTVELQRGDVYLLCSDGLHDPVAPETLAALLRNPSLEEASQSLVNAALEAGGSDNITAVLVRVEPQP